MIFMLCFFFNDTATTEIYTLSLHDALPISALGCVVGAGTSFVLSRVWAFAAGGAWAPQVSRYLAVSAATAGLNAGGVALLARSEEHTSELQSQSNLVCRLLLEKKKKI